MVTLRLSSHLLSRVGPGQAPTEREIPRSWQAACPLHAAISSVHLRENGWVLWPAPRRDNKGRAQVIHPLCQTALPPHQRLPRSAAAPRSPRAWALVACAQQWPPDTIFKVLITPNCPRSSVKPTQLTGPSRGPQSPSSPEAPEPAPLSHGLTASHSHTCVPTLCLWWAVLENRSKQIALNYIAKSLVSTVLSLCSSYHKSPVPTGLRLL